MYTAYTQLIHTLSPVLVPLILAVVFAMYFNLRWKFRSEFPGKSQILNLRKEVAKLDGEMADLEDRFTRFQKRKNMQDARQVKTEKEDLQAEAQRLLALGASGGDTGAVPQQGTGTVQDHKNALRRAVRQQQQH